MPDWKIPALCLVAALAFIEPSDILSRLKTPPAAETIRGRSGTSARPAPQGTHYRGRVTSVHDGDTVRITDTDGRKHKVRLAYIDAPEIGQAHGIESRDRLRRILSDETVDVQVTDTDRYGREVAYLFSDGLDINLSQIENGAAWHYTSIAKKQQPKADFAAYAAAEAYARAERTGLWARREPLAPWLFRKQQHTAQPQ